MQIAEEMSVASRVRVKFRVGVWVQESQTSVGAFASCGNFSAALGAGFTRMLSGPANSPGFSPGADCTGPGPDPVLFPCYNHTAGS